MGLVEDVSYLRLKINPHILVSNKTGRPNCGILGLNTRRLGTEFSLKTEKWILALHILLINVTFPFLLCPNNKNIFNWFFCWHPHKIVSIYVILWINNIDITQTFEIFIKNTNFQGKFLSLWFMTLQPISYSKKIQWQKNKSVERSGDLSPWKGFK